MYPHNSCPYPNKFKQDYEIKFDAPPPLRRQNAFAVKQSNSMSSELNFNEQLYKSIGNFNQANTSNSGDSNQIESSNVNRLIHSNEKRKNNNFKDNLNFPYIKRTRTF